MRIQPTCLFIALAFAIQARGADPGQVRPLLVQGDWEVVGRYVVEDKGIKFEDRDRDNKEWVRINRKAILVFGYGKDKPSESFDIKVIKLADQRDGVIAISDKNNGMPETTYFYRFEGSHLLLSMSMELDGKTAAFAAKGSRVIELVPYQQNRLVLTCLRPNPKPQPKAVFQNVAPPVPPNPPPVADPEK